MRDHVDRPAWQSGADHGPQLFHRTDRFRFLDTDGRLAVHRVDADSMVLARVCSTGHDITLEEPDRLSVLFPWAGRIACVVRDRTFAADAGGILAFAPNRRRTVVSRPVQGPYLADLLTLPLSGLADAQRSEDLRPGPIAPRHDPTAAAMARIRLRVGAILTAGMAGRMAGPALAGQAAGGDDLIVDLALALADPGQIAVSAGRRRVAQAIAMMRDRHSEPVSITGLARELECSCRSLQAAFHEAGHTTPQAVLAGIRLDAARVRLLSGEHSVTTAALDSGISHLGRFAADYRHRFGEKPVQTLRAGA